MGKIRRVSLALLALTFVMAVLPASPAMAAAPPAPRNLRVVEVSFTWVKLAWDAPAGSSGTRTYDARVQPGLWRAQTIENGQSFGGLQAGTPYTASVRTVSASGVMSAAVSIGFSTLERTQPAPAAPLNLRPVVAGGVVTGIAWDAVPYSAPLFYALSSGPAVLLWTSSTSVTSFQLIHHECVVEPGSTHTLIVQAWTGDHHASPQSTPITVTFPA